MGFFLHVKVLNLMAMLLLIISGQRQRTVIANHIVAVRNNNTMAKLFVTWKQQYQKHAREKQWQERQLLIR